MFFVDITEYRTANADSSHIDFEACWLYINPSDMSKLTLQQGARLDNGNSVNITRPIRATRDIGTLTRQ